MFLVSLIISIVDFSLPKIFYRLLVPLKFSIYRISPSWNEYKKKNCVFINFDGHVKKNVKTWNLRSDFFQHQTFIFCVLKSFKEEIFFKKTFLLKKKLKKNPRQQSNIPRGSATSFGMHMWRCHVSTVKGKLTTGTKSINGEFLRD